VRPMGVGLCEACEMLSLGIRRDSPALLVPKPGLWPVTFDISKSGDFGY
jgi:hypothetical protein